MPSETTELPAMPAQRQTRNGPRAIVVGGSMSGLFSAAFLRRIGWEVDVYERSPVELVGRGAGITTHPALLDSLERSGAGTRDLGIEVERRITIDRQGRVVGVATRHPGQIAQKSCNRPMFASIATASSPAPTTTPGRTST